MVGLSALWLPILLSAVAVFLVSSFIHMATSWHKGDYPKMANEDAFLNAIRPLGIPPGDYVVPRASSTQEMKSPEFRERMKKGPCVMLTVMPTGEVGMGRSLGLWFLFSIVISIFAGYVAGRALPPHPEYLQVFRFVGVTAFLGYAGAYWPMWIWYRRAFGTTVRSSIDGLLYGLITAGMFGWLWPR